MRQRSLLLAGLTTTLAVVAALAQPKTPLRPQPPPKATEDDRPDLARATNLIPNGDFEQADGDSPKHWQQVDGLTTFYVQDPDPKRNRCIKFDTDVLQTQGYEWWTKIALGQGRAKDAPRKKPTVEPKYDTLAGLDGVWYFSDFVPVKKGMGYWLTIDVKGPPLLVWLQGYENKETLAFGDQAAAFQEYLQEVKTGKKPDRGRGFEAFTYKYVWKGQLAAGGSNEWKTYSRRKMPFRPTNNTPKVKFVRVMVLPFWPPAEYWIDNVRLVEYPEDD